MTIGGEKPLQAHADAQAIGSQLGAFQEPESVASGKWAPATLSATCYLREHLRLDFTTRENWKIGARPRKEANMKCLDSLNPPLQQTVDQSSTAGIPRLASP
jgi:hypothetical protein